MAKAIRNFYGSDTYGRGVEYAQREDGEWFARHQVRNYRGWCAWYKTEEPQFETHGVNQYTGKTFKYEKPVCLWGWNKLRELDGPFRLRLP